MGVRDFEQGIKISRNFQHRSSEDTKLLYGIIQDAVTLVQENDPKHMDTAMGFLVSVYEPFIKKVAAKTVSKLGSRYDFNDVVQETYATFIMLVYKHDSTISSFSYYVNFLLPQYMYVWSKKAKSADVTTVDTFILESILVHPMLDEEDKVYDHLNASILEKEYIAFIENRALKKSRSSTVQEVCHRYFLGKETCSKIASDLEISYHAVYEIINKIKKELQYFLTDNIFTDYSMSSTGMHGRNIYKG